MTDALRRPPLPQNCILCLHFNKFIEQRTNRFRKNKGRIKTVKPNRPVSLSNMIVTALFLPDAEQFNKLI